MAGAAPHSLHPRNPHRGRYDFAKLVARTPELARFLRPAPHGDATIDFADPAAVLALNRALLLAYYGLEDWFLPAGFLCPPIPGRADTIHHLADLLAEGNTGKAPRSERVSVLDIGTGANCVYPIVGHHEYGWHFVGSETDATALRNAERLVAANRRLTGALELRHQTARTNVFRGIIGPDDHFDLTLCNPPFHASAAEAAAGSARKNRNLGNARTGRSALNFGGRPAELWCPGGESAFITRMIQESSEFRGQVGWFTSLVSKSETLARLQPILAEIGATEIRIIDMAQGQKRSRLLAWRFSTGTNPP